EAAEAAGFRDIRLNAVLLKGVNEDELGDLARLAKDRPWTVRFIELMPIGPGAAMADAFLPAGRVLEAVPELREISSTGSAGDGAPVPRRSYVGAAIGRPPEGSGNGAKQMLRSAQTDGAAGVARLYTAPGWAGAVGLIAPMSCGFCESCSRIRITADGKLKLCLHAAEEIPLRGLHGEALTKTIQEAVLRKPAGHRLSDTRPSDSARPMNEIGG
ncbi:MAG: hypothetical protein J5789_04190, partial [Oscillospiraceae bacterium]|nr:hypothetical protein [Oscillospiraceae bacterium]